MTVSHKLATMSMVPLLFRDWWDDFEWDRPARSRLLDQHFGLGLHPSSLLRTGYIRPWRNLTRQDSGSSNLKSDKEKFEVSDNGEVPLRLLGTRLQSTCSQPRHKEEVWCSSQQHNYSHKSCDNNFECCQVTVSSNDTPQTVILDVQQFTPSEITVKTTDNTVIVEAKHEEKQDEHGYISRHFIRRYVLPKDIEVKDVVSTLSSDGILTVTAPKKVISPVSSERVVPIVQTGTPAVKPAEKQPIVEQPKEASEP